MSFADHPQAVFMALASRGCAAVYALSLDGLNKMKNPYVRRFSSPIESREGHDAGTTGPGSGVGG